jgi:hypothetical protein
MAITSSQVTEIPWSTSFSLDSLPVIPFPHCQTERADSLLPSCSFFSIRPSPGHDAPSRRLAIIYSLLSCTLANKQVVVRQRENRTRKTDSNGHAILIKHVDSSNPFRPHQSVPQTGCLEPDRHLPAVADCSRGHIKANPGTQPRVLFFNFATKLP